MERYGKPHTFLLTHTNMLPNTHKNRNGGITYMCLCGTCYVIRTLPQDLKYEKNQKEGYQHHVHCTGSYCA